MIDLHPNTALMLYLSFTLAILLGLWTWHHVKSRKKKISLNEQDLFVCEFCHFVYLGSASNKITKCPQCLSFNEKNKFQTKIDKNISS